MYALYSYKCEQLSMCLGPNGVETCRNHSDEGLLRPSSSCFIASFGTHIIYRMEMCSTLIRSVQSGNRSLRGVSFECETKQMRPKRKY